MQLLKSTWPFEKVKVCSCQPSPSVRCEIYQICWAFLRRSLLRRSSAKKKQPPSSFEGSSLVHRSSCSSRPVKVLMRDMHTEFFVTLWNALVLTEVVLKTSKNHQKCLSFEECLCHIKASPSNLLRLAFRNGRSRIGAGWEHRAAKYSRLNGFTFTAFHGCTQQAVPLGHPPKSHR